MSSSKFSSPKKFYKRPAICKKAPLRSGLVWNPTYPPVLSVDFRVMDKDPPVEYSFFGNFQITRKPGLYQYTGRSDGTTEYVVCRATPIDFIGKWSFQFEIFAPGVPGEWFYYETAIAPDPTIFNSRNFGEVVVPNQDERYFRVYI